MAIPSFGKQLWDLTVALGKAQERHTLASARAHSALREEKAAAEAVNDVQVKLDAVMTELKTLAPSGTTWKPSGPPAWLKEVRWDD